MRGRRWTCEGESEEPRREKREGEDAAPSGRMNGATSDVVRGMPWRSCRIARHCGGIDYRTSERIRSKIPNNDETMDAGSYACQREYVLLVTERVAI